MEEIDCKYNKDIDENDEKINDKLKKSLEKIKPMLALDGGGLTLLCIKEGRVFVQLQGACQGCVGRPAPAVGTP